MIDSNMKEMERNLDNASKELCAAFSVAYPAIGNNAAAERNMTMHLAHQLQCDNKWTVWVEFNFGEIKERGDRRHLDCVALSKDENVLWCIEAKRLYSSEGAGAILDDIERIDHFGPARFSNKENQVRYGLVIVSAWNEMGSWWKDGSSKLPGTSGSWRDLDAFLRSRAAIRGSQEVWNNEEKRQGDPKEELWHEYFCWAAWRRGSPSESRDDGSISDRR